MSNDKPDSLQEYMTVPNGIDLIKKFSQSLVRFLSWGEVKQISTIADIFEKNPEFKAWAQKWLVPDSPKLTAWVGKSFDPHGWKVASQMKVGQVAERSPYPAHNWTLSPEVAKSYATGTADKSSSEYAGGYVAKQEIPRELVYLYVNLVSQIFHEWASSPWGERVLAQGSNAGKEFMKYVISLANSADHFKEEDEIIASGKAHSPVIVQKTK